MNPLQPTTTHPAGPPGGVPSTGIEGAEKAHPSCRTYSTRRGSPHRRPVTNTPEKYHTSRQPLSQKTRSRLRILGNSHYRRLQLQPTQLNPPTYAECDRVDTLSSAYCILLILIAILRQTKHTNFGLAILVSCHHCIPIAAAISLNAAALFPKPLYKGQSKHTSG